MRQARPDDHAIRYARHRGYTVHRHARGILMAQKTIVSLIDVRRPFYSGSGTGFLRTSAPH
ncbi:hypothetical protein Franean1_4400 [Parafrankia sp. EAN1pec]|nr:hypothetical protein Franean1_4400 [Frankia sp. EAN1pec]